MTVVSLVSGIGYDWRMEMLNAVATITFANLLTAWFLWGCWRARDIHEGDHIDGTTVLSLICPLLFCAGGLYLSG